MYYMYRPTSRHTDVGVSILMMVSKIIDLIARDLGSGILTS